MDPNAGKKYMFNKLSKEQCVTLLEKENFKRVTVSFYKYIILGNLMNLRDDLYKNWNDLSVLGRIYLFYFLEPFLKLLIFNMQSLEFN